jgi:hypothetical protein
LANAIEHGWVLEDRKEGSGVVECFGRVVLQTLVIARSRETCVEAQKSYFEVRVNEIWTNVDIPRESGWDSEWSDLLHIALATLPPTRSYPSFLTFRQSARIRPSF